MGAVLALLASISWGTGDFFGGTLSRRAHPVAVMRASQTLALAGLVVVAVVAGSFGDSGYLLWGVLGGIVGVMALGCFYTALAEGTMGVVAPIAGTGVLVPVAVGLAKGETPGILQLVGIVVTIVGVILASGPERGGHDRREGGNRPLILAAFAALGFGATLATVAEGAQHSVVMTLLTMRAVNVLLASAFLATAGRHLTRPVRRELPSLVVAGGTDAGANGLYALATHASLVSVSSVLASLYPAVTALLAWRFHQERLRRVQLVGVVCTLGGVAMIAAGGG